MFRGVTHVSMVNYGGDAAVDALQAAPELAPEDVVWGIVE